MKLKKPKILVVDDMPNNRLAMSKLLRRIDCEVIVAESGNSALALCIEHDFALIMLDVDMPSMDGYEVARFLKEEPLTKHTPIMFVTASVEDKEHILLGYKSGAVDYIQKPVDDIILLSKAAIFIELYNNRQLAQRELDRSEAMRLASMENEQRFRQALNDAPIPVMLHAEDGKVILLSKEWQNLTGYSQNDIPSIDAWLLKAYGAENIEIRQHAIQQQFENNHRKAPIELKIRTANGSFLTWVFNSNQLAPLPDGRRLMIMMATDITERKLAEEQLQQASLVFENSSEGMMITDADGMIISINPAFTKLTGYSAVEMIGNTPKLLQSGKHNQDFYQAMWHKLNTTGHWQGEIRNKRKNGSEIVEWLTINTIFNDDKTPLRRVALFSDITKKKQDEELIWHQANFDALTGLSNRRMFLDRLATVIKESQRDHSPLALIYLDLDEFKAVNDTLGHDMGDILLQETAQRLLGCVRSTDIVSRLGGDEFTIIIERLDRSINVDRIAQLIIEKLSEPFLLGDKMAHVSASLGITLYPDDASDIETLLKNADQAMYAAKNKGRHCYSYFTPAMQQTIDERLRIINELRNALNNQQFQLYYQPIVNLKSGNIVKAEALIRWHHPTLGLIPPNKFIPLAEETGTIIEIGEWVFQQAATQVAKWRSKYNSEFQISINKSPVQFTNQKDEHAAWIKYLHTLNLTGASIIVEITESLLLDINSNINDKLLNFRDAGIQVSIDDFGTGYSSLSYLQKLDIDYLKIDQSFIHNLTENSNELALCLAIITMAHKLGLKVIAEGIETEIQRDLLVSMDCDYGQGYLFSKPVPADKFETYLENSAYPAIKN